MQRILTDMGMIPDVDTTQHLLPRSQMFQAMLAPTTIPPSWVGWVRDRGSLSRLSRQNIEKTNGND